MKIPISLLLLGVPALLHADTWTTIPLNPSGVVFSGAAAAMGTRQAGVARLGDPANYTGNRAVLWNGISDNLVNLQPAGATYSLVSAMTETQQGGSVTFGAGAYQAALWSGTAESYVSLHPPTAGVGEESSVYAMAGNQQAGFSKFGGVPNAVIWSGDAASCVNLHPTIALPSTVDSSYVQATTGTVQGGYIVIKTPTENPNAPLYSRHAAKWSGSAASFVDLHPAGASDSYVYAAAGSVLAGHAVFSGDDHAAIWSGPGSGFTDLHPSEASSSRIQGASGSLQVGWIQVAGSWRAALWSGTVASLVDLHAFLPAGVYSHSIAQGVWTDGEATYVAGVVYRADTMAQEAYLWKSLPGSTTPPPTTVVPPSAPRPVIFLASKRISTTKSQTKVKGFAAYATGIRYRVGSRGGWQTGRVAASGTWTAKAKRLKPRRNVLSVVGTGAGGESAPAKATIVRKASARL